MTLSRLARVLAFLLLALLVVWGAVLVEAHVEMGGVQPPIPDRSQFAELARVADGPVRIRYVNTGSQPWAAGRVGTYGGFLLEWADGRSLLIDVGMERQGVIEFGATFRPLLGGDPPVPHGSVAEQLGDAARRVQGVAFTHLHWDHTGGMKSLCRAAGHPIRVFQTPDQAERGNYGTRPGRTDVEEAGCTETVRLGDGPFESIDGFPGLVAIAAGGHTPGSTLFATYLEGTTWVLAGDITNSMANLRADVPKPWVYSLLIVPEARERLGVLRRWLARLDEDPAVRVVVAHDLGAIEASGMAIYGR